MSKSNPDTRFSTATLGLGPEVKDIYELDRDSCRVEVPGPVKDIIMQYIDL